MIMDFDDSVRFAAVADENGEEIILPKVSYSKDVLILKK